MVVQELAGLPKEVKVVPEACQVKETSLTRLGSQHI